MNSPLLTYNVILMNSNNKFGNTSVSVDIMTSDRSSPSPSPSPVRVRVLEVNMNNNNIPQTTLSDFTLRFLFLIMGMGTLFAYNAFISCIDYFNSINKDVRNVSGQMVAFQFTAMLLATICWLPFSTFSKKNYTPTPRQRNNNENEYECDNYIDRNSSNEQLPIEGNSRLIMTFESKRCMSLTRNKIREQLDFDVSSPSTRVLIGFSFTFVFLLVFLLLPPPSIFVLNVFSVFVGVADATSQSGLYTLAASYKRPSYSTAAVLGSAMSGFIVSLLRLMTRSIFDATTEDGLRKGSYILMGISFAFTVILIIVTCILKRDIYLCDITTQSPTIVSDNKLSMKQQQDFELTCHIEEESLSKDAISQDNIEEMNEVESDGCINQLREVYINTLRITWKPVFSAFLNFFITLSLFPVVIVTIPSSAGFISFGDWLPVVLITIFNAADCAGRYILWFESWKPFQALMTRRNSISDSDCTDRRNQIGIETLKNYNAIVWWPTFARFTFLPVLALCIIPANKPLLHNDMLTCIIVFFFGLSNGFIHCANFAVGPTIVDNEESRNAASLLLLLAVFLGLTLGAYFGIVVEHFIWFIAE